MADNSAILTPAAKAGAAIGSAAVVNVERIGDVITGAAQVVSVHPLLQMTWPNIAAAAAAMFSLSMLLDWWWRKFWRPLFERIGWLKPKPVIRLTHKEWVAYMAAESMEPDSTLGGPPRKLQ